MKLTVVGCAGSFASAESPASCYLVEVESAVSQGGRTWRILLDLGSGAFGALQGLADPLKIDAVLFSHLHADHCLDLCGYYVFRKYHPTGAQPAIPVYGPAGVADRMARAYDLPLDPGMHAEFTFTEYDDQPIEIGPFTITAVPVKHPVPAVAFRIEAQGRTLVYSGDTGPCSALDELAKGANLLLAEAAFVTGGDNPPDLHLTGADCGQVASSADVDLLVLTHVPAWHDPATALAEARATYAGPMALAHAGDAFKV